MAYRTIEVTSLVEIIELIGGKDSFFESRTKGFCYRGHAFENWSLIPSAFREVDRYADRETKIKVLDVERETYRSFNDRFRGLQAPLVDRQSSWELLCYAQHFGVPTRLLDWTTNPLIALYFAVTENPNDDAALWCLAQENGRYELGKSINQLEENYKFLSPFLKNGSRGDYISSSEIVLIQPPDIETRIRNQAGVFSVQLTSDPGELVINHLDELGRRADRLLKVRIPAISKSEIRLDLEKLGIDAAFVRPDIEGIAQRLREQREVKYEEQEISIPTFVASSRNIFTEYVEAFIGDKLQWEWKPGQYHELLLRVNENTYAVRVDEIDLRNIEEIKSFVAEIERILLEEGNLKGSYHINFGNLQMDWRDYDHKVIKDKLLNIIRETRDLPEYNQEYVLNHVGSISVTKKGYHADRVIIGTYSKVWWGSTDYVELDLEKWDKEIITQKIQSIKIQEKYKSILILTIAATSKYNLEDYARHIRTIDHELAAIFLIIPFEKGFVVDHIFDSTA